MILIIGSQKIRETMINVNKGLHLDELHSNDRHGNLIQRGVNGQTYK